MADVESYAIQILKIMTVHSINQNKEENIEALGINERRLAIL